MRKPELGHQVWNLKAWKAQWQTTTFRLSNSNISWIFGEPVSWFAWTSHMVYEHRAKAVTDSSASGLYSKNSIHFWSWFSRCLMSMYYWVLKKNPHFYLNWIPSFQINKQTNYSPLTEMSKEPLPFNRSKETLLIRTTLSRLRHGISERECKTSHWRSVSLLS